MRVGVSHAVSSLTAHFFNLSIAPVIFSFLVPTSSCCTSCKHACRYELQMHLFHHLVWRLIYLTWPNKSRLNLSLFRKSSLEAWKTIFQKRSSHETNIVQHWHPKCLLFAVLEGLFCSQCCLCCASTPPPGSHLVEALLHSQVLRLKPC